MRSNYKLIIWYPSLPKDWEVGMEVGQGDRNAMMANFSPLSSKYSDVQLPYKEVVNNSKFWDEVSEFPKIVSFRRTDTSEYIINLTGKDNYNGWSLGGMLHTGECVDSGDIEIYQVAVSETEVFTLGDKVTYNYKANYAPWIVDNFLLRSDGKILARSKSNSICEIVSEIKKAPELLFVTEDGIEKYIDEDFYYIGDAWNLCLTKCLYKGDGDFSKFKTFHNIEAAQKYIDENEPIYSKKQVREALECAVHEYIKYVNSTSWERTFKQKLNL